MEFFNKLGVRIRFQVLYGVYIYIYIYISCSQQNQSTHERNPFNRAFQGSPLTASSHGKVYITKSGGSLQEGRCRRKRTRNAQENKIKNPKAHEIARIPNGRVWQPLQCFLWRRWIISMPLLAIFPEAGEGMQRWSVLACASCGISSILLPM